jgi:type II restriction enzyme
MDFEDLKHIYLQKKEIYNNDAYKHISEILKEAKKKHHKDWLKHPTAGKDHEQSWRAFKGKNLEKLIQYIITDEVEILGLKVINGNQLERSTNLSPQMSKVKRNLAIDYGEFGLHLPDVDIVIYNPKNCKVIAVISSKVTMRERIAQTAYWKLKLLQDKTTKHIQVYFITPDEDDTLTSLDYNKVKKGRAIVEKDLDGTYVLTDVPINESSKVKLFEHFIDDLKLLIKYK